MFIQSMFYVNEVNQYVMSTKDNYLHTEFGLTTDMTRDQFWIGQDVWASLLKTAALIHLE